MQDLQSLVKSIRQTRGFAQTQLATAVGLTRQALGAIESGRYIPNTAVALRLARALGCRVEDLWVGTADQPTVPVAVVGGAPPGTRVSLARVRQRVIAYPLSGDRVVEEGFAPADGQLLAEGASARLHDRDGDLDASALLLGCDPAFRLLTHHLARSGRRLIWRSAASTAALTALAAGETHLAGTHLTRIDGEPADLGPAEAALKATGGSIVTFARWEQGLMVAPGNPHDLRSVADLADPRLRIINREIGSGSRRLLDDLLGQAGMPGTAVRGYERLARSHLDAARRVAVGEADVALGLRAAALACGLDFVPLIQVRCDLAVPTDLDEHPVVAAVLDALQSAALRADLASLPGYESGDTGTVVTAVPLVGKN